MWGQNSVRQFAKKIVTPSKDGPMIDPMMTEAMRKIKEPENIGGMPTKDTSSETG